MISTAGKRRIMPNKRCGTGQSVCVWCFRARHRQKKRSISPPSASTNRQRRLLKSNNPSRIWKKLSINQLRSQVTLYQGRVSSLAPHIRYFRCLLWPCDPSLKRLRVAVAFYMDYYFVEKTSARDRLMSAPFFRSGTRAPARPPPQPSPRTPLQST